LLKATQEAENLKSLTLVLNHTSMLSPFLVEAKFIIICWHFMLQHLFILTFISAINNALPSNDKKEICSKEN
jgi:hypothetical protein